MKYLIIAIINLIYGVLLLLTLTSDTPGLMITLVVAFILAMFGIWGVVLWLQTTIKSHRDKAVDDEPINNWWKMVRAFDIILIIGLFCRFFIIQPFVVDGPSMEPTFNDKEAILVDKISWKLRTPERGEIVIFKAPPQPNEDYIKRIIGLPGEEITIENSKILINGHELSETYLPTNGLSTDEYYQKTLGPNEYFVIGDNRQHSSDSRDWGAVPKKNLVGRALVIVFPINKFGMIRNPELSL